MNGGQDLGGTHGFGPVVREADEPVFHHDWERRIFALTLAMGACGEWNIDMSRFARENQPPQEYLSKSYYELWLAGLEALLAERGLVSAGELASGRPAGTARPVKRVLKAGDVAQALARGGPCDRQSNAKARFSPGSKVRTRNIHPQGHTRLPRYARSRAGVVKRCHGVFVFPDASAAGAGEQPQHLYSVAFSARELWGEEADRAQVVHTDLWESYLEPA